MTKLKLKSQNILTKILKLSALCSILTLSHLKTVQADTISAGIQNLGYGISYTSDLNDYCSLGSSIGLGAPLPLFKSLSPDTSNPVTKRALESWGRDLINNLQNINRVKTIITPMTFEMQLQIYPFTESSLYGSIIAGFTNYEFSMNWKNNVITRDSILIKMKQGMYLGWAFGYNSRKHVESGLGYCLEFGVSRSLNNSMSVTNTLRTAEDSTILGDVPMFKMMG